MSERLHEQLSALLDGELPAGEAELLLARLQRDPALRATLGRYTLAGDAIRIASLGAAATVAPVASAGFASRISAAIEAEAQQEASVLAGLGVVEPRAAAATPAVAQAASRPASVRGRRRLAAAGRWLRPLGGVAMAAGVAGLALMALPQGRVGEAGPTVASVPAAVTAPAAVAPAPAVAPVAAPAPMLAAASSVTSAGLPVFDRSGEPASYTTPLSVGGPSPTFIPSAELASYVVAHSEVSGPLARRNVLTGLAAEPAPPAVAPANAADPDLESRKP